VGGALPAAAARGPAAGGAGTRARLAVTLLSIVLAFGVAMWALGAGWAALRAAWSHPSPAGLAALAAYTAVFLAAFLYLGFWAYAADRSAGKVRRPIGLYERILTRRDRRDA